MSDLFGNHIVGFPTSSIMFTFNMDSLGVVVGIVAENRSYDC